VEEIKGKKKEDEKFDVVLNEKQKTLLFSIWRNANYEDLVGSKNFKTFKMDILIGSGLFFFEEPKFVFNTHSMEIFIWTYWNKFVKEVMSLEDGDCDLYMEVLERRLVWTTMTHRFFPRSVKGVICLVFMIWCSGRCDLSLLTRDVVFLIFRWYACFEYSYNVK